MTLTNPFTVQYIVVHFKHVRGVFAL